MAVTSFSVESWDPIKADSPNGQIMLGQVYDWMFQFEAGKLMPGVVEKWQIAPDGLSWTYNIRKGIKFTDGSELTAKDIKFSIERYMSKDSFYSHTRTAVDRVDAVDDYTVRIYTKSPQPFLPYYQGNCYPQQGLVMSADYFSKSGVENAIKNPMGSGPWTRTKYVPGDSIEFTAKASHWRQLPAFKTLTVIKIPESATQVAMLKAGDVDVITVGLDNATDLEKAGYTTYPLFAAQGGIRFHGTYDPRAKGMPTADIRVRQALAMAINQEEISKTVFYGKALPPVPSRILYGQDDIDTDYWVQYLKQAYRYDPAKAKELLKEAGYPNGFSGLKLYVTPQAGLDYMDKLCAIVQQYWKAIGVNADLVPMELATYTPIRKEPGALVVGQALVGSTGVLAPAVINLEFLYGSKGGSPLTAWNSPQGPVSYTPELDKSIYSAMTEVDPTKRREMTAQAIKLSVDTYTAFTFGQVPTMMVTGPKVKFDLKDLKQPLPGSSTPAFAGVAQHK